MLLDKQTPDKVSLRVPGSVTAFLLVLQANQSITSSNNNDKIHDNNSKRTMEETATRNYCFHV